MLLRETCHKVSRVSQMYLVEKVWVCWEEASRQREVISVRPLLNTRALSVSFPTLFTFIESVCVCVHCSISNSQNSFWHVVDVQLIFLHGRKEFIFEFGFNLYRYTIDIIRDDINIFQMAGSSILCLSVCFKHLISLLLLFGL